MDEGYTINAVLGILEHGTQTLDSGQTYACPMYCYPTAAIAKTFGENAFSYRILAALAGTLFIVVIYFAGAQLFGPVVGLLAAFFATFSYWQIAWSRQARWYTLFEVFIWLAIISFYKALYGEKHNRWWAASCAVLTALAAATHGLGLLLPFIFLAWAVGDKVLRTKNWTHIFTLALGILVAGAALFIKFDIHLNYELPYYLNFYLRNYWLFVILAVIALLSRIKNKEKLLLLFIFTAYLAPLSFFTDLVEYRYLFHLTPAFYLLGAVGVVELCRYFSSKPLYKWPVIAVAGIVFFASGQGLLVPAQAYFLESDDPSALSGRPHYAYTPQPDWNSAYAFIAGNRAVGDIIISSMPQFNKIFLGEPGYWLKYDYLGGGGAQNNILDDHEYYVGATVLTNLADLQGLTTKTHGYLVLDYMATDGRIPQEVLGHIKTNFSEVFYKKTNFYSQVWVYRF